MDYLLVLEDGLASVAEIPYGENRNAFAGRFVVIGQFSARHEAENARDIENNAASRARSSLRAVKPNGNWVAPPDDRPYGYRVISRAAALSMVDPASHFG